MFESLPLALAAFDKKRGTSSPEPIVTQMIWASLAALPAARAQLGLNPDSTWWRQGGHGVGDLTGYNAADELLDHVELKSKAAKASEGAGCRGGCGVTQSQFAHFRCSAPNSGIMVITHSYREVAAQQMLQAAGVTDGRVKSFADLGEAIRVGLADPGRQPFGDFAAALLDVEEEFEAAKRAEQERTETAARGDQGLIP